MSGVVLRFDRLPDGTLIAVHQGVAAIVHHLANFGYRRWELAGDGDWTDRPHGTAASRVLAMAEAADALGAHLGVTIDGYELAAAASVPPSTGGS